MAIITKPITPIVRGSSATITLNVSELESHPTVVAHPILNDPLKWQRVSLTYTSSVLDMVENIIFDMSGGVSDSGNFFASSLSQGNFLVRCLIIFDDQGGYLVLDRPDLNVADFDIIFDETAPAITNISVPAAATYAEGEVLSFSVQFSENVIVSGSPILQINIGGVTRDAQFISGSNTNTLLFQYTVVLADLDIDGILLISPISLNGGSIADAASNNANLTFNPASFDTSGVLIQTIVELLGSSFATGNNNNGRLGDGTTTLRSTPTAVSGGYSDFVSIHAGDSQSFGIRSDGSIWAWGDDTYFLGLGNPQGTHKSTPTKIVTQSNFVKLATSFETKLALKSDGTIWGWGFNNYGQLGLGDTSVRSVPTQVIGHSDVMSIAGGKASQGSFFLLKSDGVAWAAGINSSFRLGVGDSVDRSTFVQIIGHSNFKQIDSGTGGTYAIKSDGTLWAVGDNNFPNRYLGLPLTQAYSSFSQVTTISDCMIVSAGNNFAFVIKSDGTLWSCGRNDLGQLGLGNTTNRSSFTQVTGHSNFKNVKCSSGVDGYALAIKSDGTVWGVGYNGWRNLGLGDNTNRSTFAQVTTITNVFDASAGGIHTLFLKS